MEPHAQVCVPAARPLARRRARPGGGRKAHDGADGADRRGHRRGRGEAGRRLAPRVYALRRTFVRRVVWLTAATVAAVAAMPAERGGGASASRVVDRTLVCTLVAPLGSARDLDVSASPPIVDEFRNFSVPAHIGVGSGRVLAGS